MDRENGIVSRKNKIRVFSVWRCIDCILTSGRIDIVDNVCCNRKCECLVSAQKVSKNFNHKDLDIPGLVVSYADRSYECPASSEDKQCQIECFKALATVLDRTDLENPNLSQYNLDIFANNDHTSELVIFLFFYYNEIS